MGKLVRLATLLVTSLAANAMFFEFACARAGGGGSSSGGGSFSSGSFSSSGGSSSIASGSNSFFEPLGFIVIAVLVFVLLAIGFIVSFLVSRRKMQQMAQAKEDLEAAALSDSIWEENSLEQDVFNLFYKFQHDWSELNAEPMMKYLTYQFYKKIVLELNVLKNERRKNFVNHPRIISISIMNVEDFSDNSKDRFTAEITATANDVLVDEETGKKLYVDNSVFSEYWTFLRQDNIWKLDEIRQSTEDARFVESAVIDFAKRNKFFYDPDFGWLMMPNKGAIFRRSNFKTSDINNHVIGYFRDKIVEFYTYVPNPHDNARTNYIVAQAVLPKRYDNILVRRKRMLLNFGPWGMRRIHTESNDFERKFCLWVDSKDQVNAFELLSPNFMEKAYELPFELNIELVGNFIYFYAKSRKDINYDKMLEIMSWAFDEMKQ